MFTEKLTKDNYALLTEELQKAADPKYRDFHASLVPNEDKGRILGVRMPRLRKIARAAGKDDPRGFLEICGDDTYEERILRAIVTGMIVPSDCAELCALADGFLPYVNCWAVCDCFCAGLKQVKKYRAAFFEHIGAYLSGDMWAQRVSMVMMLSYYLDEMYIDRVLARVDSVRAEAYYVQMAQAWLLATAPAKCPAPTLAYYCSNSLDSYTQNKAIQKALESRRIDDETKKVLRALRSA